MGVCCKEDGNDKGCCCCLPSKYGIWTFGILTFLAWCLSVGALFIDNAKTVRSQQSGMSDEYYSEQEEELFWNEIKFFISTSLKLLPFLLVLFMPKSYGPRLCLFLMMILFFVLDIG